MIATKIENTLRRRLYDIFLREYTESFESEKVRIEIIRCIERTALFTGSQWIMPDRFLITVSEKLCLSQSDTQTLKMRSESIIENYQKDSGYNRINELHIDVILKTAAKTSIEVSGWITLPEGNPEYFIAALRNCEELNRPVTFLDVVCGETYLVGRSNRADIRIQHPFISYEHAQVIINKWGETAVCDLHSVNGTFVNGKRLLSHRIIPADLPVSIVFGGVYELYIRLKASLFCTGKRC